jgi:hypothetical protein
VHGLIRPSNTGEPAPQPVLIVLHQEVSAIICRHAVFGSTFVGRRWAIRCPKHSPIMPQSSCSAGR